MEHSIIDYILHNDETHEAVRNSKEYNKVSDKRYKIHNKLREMLTEEQREEFDKYIDLELEEFALSNEAYFKLGIKMGVRLVSESMFDF